jgi:hypothetical protein
MAAYPEPCLAAGLNLSTANSDCHLRTPNPTA